MPNVKISLFLYCIKFYIDWLTDHGWNTDIFISDFLTVRQPEQVVKQWQQQVTKREGSHPRLFFLLGQPTEYKLRYGGQNHANHGHLSKREIYNL